MSDNLNLEHSTGGTLVRIPMILKKRGGRKEIIVSNSLAERASKQAIDVPFAIALARAYAWQELLDSGKYRSINAMAQDLGVCNSYVRRLLRFTILAPHIVESTLNGSESDRISQTKLTGEIPADWRKQWELWGD